MSSKKDKVLSLSLSLSLYYFTQLSIQLKYFRMTKFFHGLLCTLSGTGEKEKEKEKEKERSAVSLAVDDNLERFQASKLGEGWVSVERERARERERRRECIWPAFFHFFAKRRKRDMTEEERRRLGVGTEDSY